MSKTPLLSLLFCLLFVGQYALAGNGPLDPETQFKKYVNNIVVQVEATDDPAQKRVILNTSLERMTEAFRRVEQSERLSLEERQAVAALRASVEEKLDELNGRNGFTPVPDSNLNHFANYVQQDIEQAERKVTLSLTALLLIIIIVLLIA